VQVIHKAIKLLQEGEVIAAPTETVYGLFGDATSDIAIQKIYKIKKRPSCNPLILHVSSIEMASQYAEISQENWKFIDLFWNSLRLPITFILPFKKNSGISELVTAGLSTVAVRKPNHALSYYLIDMFGKPLAAPSANTSTMVSPTSYEMVVNDIGDKIPLVIDGGNCEVGIESTILDITQKPYTILRQGGTTLEDIQKYIKGNDDNSLQIAVKNEKSSIKAPGMMKKHYAPGIPLRMNASHPFEKEAFLAFGKTYVNYDYNLSENGDVSEAAKNLFSAIKKFDNPNLYKGIAVMPIPNEGIGAAINDRLKRASFHEKGKKILLIILDGFGISENILGNATLEAKYIQTLLKTQKSSRLSAEGRYVGLPDGQFGNSEVGHITIGTGRIVKQKLCRINDSIKDGTFDQNPALLEFLSKTKTCHIMGLFSDGGVHSHISHFFHAIKILRKLNIDIKAHLFLDGRDVSHDDALKTLKLAVKNRDIILEEIATIQGRFYAMDRDKRWDRTKAAYEAIIAGKHQHHNKIENPLQWIENCYENEIYDEEILPFVMKSYNGIVSVEDDSFWMLNFRTDRIIQLLSMIKQKNLLNMVNINEEIDTRSFIMFPQKSMKNTLGETVSVKGLKQLRLAETEKYAHVTYFFNGGGNNIQYEGEDRILIDSPKVADYSLTPDMSSSKITETLLQNLGNYDLIIVNYASPDMIGHTNNFEATKESIRLLDIQIKKVVEYAVALKYDIILTSDHGNAENMLNMDGTICKTHTNNPVPFIYIGDACKTVINGELMDIAPTILSLLDIDKPEDMSGKNLLL
jgi:2,3-bisphosphoglycerate-independent phosphoglycerate mutase